MQSSLQTLNKGVSLLCTPKQDTIHCDYFKSAVRNTEDVLMLSCTAILTYKYKKRIAIKKFPTKIYYRSGT